MGGDDEERKRGAPSREAKLAQALRANLRRRKAAVRAEPSESRTERPKPERSD